MRSGRGREGTSTANVVALPKRWNSCGRSALAATWVLPLRSDVLVAVVTFCHCEAGWYSALGAGCH